MQDVPEQRKIRTTYYIVFLVILLIQFISFSLIYFNSLQKDYDLISTQLYDSIMDQKRNQLRLVVNEKIVEINEFETILSDQLTMGAEAQCRLIVHYIESESLSDFLDDYTGWFPSSAWSFRIFDRVTGREYRNSPEEKNNPTVQNLKPADFRMSASDRYDVYVYASPGFYYETFFSGVRELVYATRLPQDGYVWINWVQNYKGGDDYAVRLIHPNLPETEGSALSTRTEDIRGNRPYRTELEGINTAGEVMHEYYFKKMNSDEIIRKLSYARLMKKFNWIVATGVNLDDVDAGIARDRDVLKVSFSRKKDLFIGSITIAVIFSLIMITLFEKRVSLIINTYIREYEREHKKLTDAYDSMKKMAYVDTMTNLLNRRAMYEILEKEMSLYRRGKAGFCIILADVDKFKAVNDTYGHDTGDFILKETARILGNCIRMEDRMSRWGGEEFLFFIPQSTLAEGISVAEKLRKTMEDHPFQDETVSLKVTMTFGVSACRDGLDLKSMIKEADEKLYQGKRSTRNCVVG